MYFHLSVIIFHLFQDCATPDTHMNYRVKCQPTIKSCPVFRDILIEVVNGRRSFLIEVKRIDIYTNILLETDATAQIFRETHLYLQDRKHLKEILFILTNCIEWSFGKTEIADTNHEKIKVTSTGHYSIESEFSQIYLLMKKLIF